MQGFIKSLMSCLVLAFVLAVGLGALANPASALEVKKVATFNHPPGRVWKTIGEFGWIDRWHPAVAMSEVEGDGGSGIYRNLTLGDGGTMRELLLAYSFEERFYRYAIIEGVLPVANYLATLRVRQGTEPQRTIIEWSSRFDAAGVSAEEAVSLIGGIYQAGFDNLRKILGGQ